MTAIGYWLVSLVLFLTIISFWIIGLLCVKILMEIEWKIFCWKLKREVEKRGKL